MFRLSNWHRWLGLALSAMLLVISITGVLLIWKPEYQRLSVIGADQTLRTELPFLASSIDAIIASYETESIKLIQVYPEQVSLFKVFLFDKQYAWHAPTGELLETWSSNGRLEDFLLDLHHRFLLGNTIGLNMAGFTGLLMLPLMLIGFVLWWPRRRTLKKGLLPRGSERGRYMMSHSNIGGISVLPFLIIAISGVILVYPVEAAKVLLPGYAESEKPHIVDIESGPLANNTLAQLQIAEQYFPNATIRWLRPPNANYSQTIVGLQQANSWNRQGKTTVNFAAGRAVQINDALKQPAAKRVYDFMFPMHTGMLPLWYRLLLTVFGAGLAMVSLFGIVSWLKKNNP